MDVKHNKKQVLAGIVVCSLSAATNASASHQLTETLVEVSKQERIQEFSELNNDTLLIEEIEINLATSKNSQISKKRHVSESDVSAEPWWKKLLNSMTTGSKDSEFS